jgi:hypothetical protein
MWLLEVLVLGLGLVLRLVLVLVLVLALALVLVLVLVLVRAMSNSWLRKIADTRLSRKSSSVDLSCRMVWYGSANGPV